MKVVKIIPSEWHSKFKKNRRKVVNDKTLPLCRTTAFNDFFNTVCEKFPVIWVVVNSNAVQNYEDIVALQSSSCAQKMLDKSFDHGQ